MNKQFSNGNNTQTQPESPASTTPVSPHQSGNAYLNKQKDNWRKAPWWVRHSLAGVSSRQTAIRLEQCAVLSGSVGFMSAISEGQFSLLMAFYASAWSISVAVRWLDNEQVWTSQPL